VTFELMLPGLGGCSSGSVSTVQSKAASGVSPDSVALADRRAGAASDKRAAGPVVAAVVSHERLFRDGVESILRDRGFSIRYSIPSVGDLLTRLRGNAPPDVLILLGILPLNPDEVCALQTAREAVPKVRIIILAENDCDPAQLERLMSIGVDALLPIDLSAEALVEALLLVLLGEGFMFIEFMQRLLARRELAVMPPTPDLTARQLDIVRLLAEGCSNKTIAEWLHATEGAVKVEIRRLLRKLGAANRTQAAIWAMERGLVSETGPSPD
jgi:two-component system nitrate/nitrite response regulator NarL